MREPNPTEPSNYTGSYTRLRKKIVDTEITMRQRSGTILLQMLPLLKLTIFEEQKEEGGLRN
jgi:hypothetical protein